VRCGHVTFRLQMRSAHDLSNKLKSEITDEGRTSKFSPVEVKLPKNVLNLFIEKSLNKDLPHDFHVNFTHFSLIFNF